MNKRMILYLIGRILQIESALLALPITVSLVYSENPLPFIISSLIALASGTLLTILSKPKDQMIFAREGFIIVTFAWLLMSVVGSLPFVISREIPSFVDAFFETVSGFTTTGASILDNVEALSKSSLFWRSFTHWIGGMGVLVLIMAIFPSESGRSIHILRAEMPGPSVGKIVPRVKDTAKILYIIYIALTLMQVIFLLFGGMSLYESLVHAFGTAGTGGFGIKSDSIAGYSPYIQWVISIFMLIFGLNFNLFYLILIKKFSQAIKSSELWTYLGIVAASISIITVNLLSSPLYSSVKKAFSDAFFQVSSIITTTGYATADFNLWPTLSKSILLILMFIGGCAGSTAGGLKISRLILSLKLIKQHLRKIVHPRSVGAITFEGKKVEEQTITGVSVYLSIYFVIFAILFIITSLEPISLETSFSAVTACFNNVGPGFDLVGPSSSYSALSDITKVLLSFAMLLGRLEIFPILVTLLPSTWKRK